MLARKYKDLFAGIKFSKDNDNFIGKNITITMINSEDENKNKSIELTLKEFLKMTKNK